MRLSAWSLSAVDALSASPKVLPTAICAFQVSTTYGRSLAIKADTRAFSLRTRESAVAIGAPVVAAALSAGARPSQTGEAVDRNSFHLSFEHGVFSSLTHIEPDRTDEGAQSGGHDLRG
jgi:hypothetical protein